MKKGARADYDGKTDPYVRVIKATLKEPAWLAMSYGARCLYIVLKSYYNGDNNGRIYIGVRRAAKELGAGPASTQRWFRELHEHGFIRPTQGAFLGLDGKGLATHWRLTEIGYLKEPATRDFKSWKPPENKTPISKRARTVLKTSTPCAQDDDTCAQNDDAFAPVEATDRTQNDSISTSPYVAPIPSLPPRQRRSEQARPHGSAQPSEPHSARGVLAEIQKRLRHREPVPAIELQGFRESVVTILQTASGTDRAWGERLLSDLEMRAAA